MTASLETLVVAAYVFADPSPQVGQQTTDHELIALAVTQAATRIYSDRHVPSTGRM
jgi:hypothetical protein